MNEEDYTSEYTAMEKMAETAGSAKDFIEFLDALEKQIVDDDEADKRVQLEFISVISRKLKYAFGNPNEEALDIEVPNMPNWSWIARLFRVGAFEN